MCLWVGKTSCVSVASEVVKISGKRYEAVSPLDVQIFMETTELPVQYERVVMIYGSFNEGYAAGDARRWKSMWENIKMQAAKYGCNGVYAHTSLSNGLPTAKQDTLQRNQIILTPSQKQRGIFVGIRYQR